MIHRFNRFRIGALSLIAAMTVPVAVRGHDGHDHAPLAAPAADHHSAVQFLEDRLVSNPDDVISLSRLAGLRLEAARSTGEHARFVAAARDFRRLSRLKPDSETAQVGLCYALLGQHRFEEALGIARPVAESLPDTPQIWQLLGDLHFALGHYVEAEMAFTRLVAHELTLQSMSRMAHIHELRGRRDEAVRWMTDALEAGRLLDESPSALAWCLTMLGDSARQRGQTELAQAHYRSALELDRQAHVAEFRLAELTADQGAVRQAEQTMRKLIEQVSRPAYWIALGDLLASDGRQAEAEVWFAKAEETMSANITAGDMGHARELVEFWLNHGRSTDAAVELALRDLCEVRRDSGAYEVAAWALHQAGRTQEAVDYIRSALRPGPSSVQLLWRGGVIYHVAEKQREARRLMHLALELNPHLDGSMRAAADRVLSRRLAQNTIVP